MFNKNALIIIGVVLFIYGVIFPPPKSIEFMRQPMITASIILLVLGSTYTNLDKKE